MSESAQFTTGLIGWFIKKETPILDIICQGQILLLSFGYIVETLFLVRGCFVFVLALFLDFLIIIIWNKIL